MQLNLLIPMRATKHLDRWLEGSQLGDVARFAEEAGYHGVSATDHPFPDDKWLSQGGHHSLDPFVALSFMAAVTTRVKLLTYVLVSGYRHPYVYAKGLASLDKLSGGRLVAGMAAGYLQSEFEVLEAPWKTRGARFDAALVAMRAAWTGASVDIEGPFAAHGHTQLPPPAQPGGPPIWIGGNSGAARRRAATLAQGWMPIGQPESMAAITKTPALETIEQLAELIAGVRRQRAEVTDEPFDVCFAPFGDQTDPDAWVGRITEDHAAYEAAGVTWLTIEPQCRSFGDFRALAGRVAQEVLPR